MIVSTVRARPTRVARALGVVAVAFVAVLCALSTTGCAHKGGTKTAQTSAAPESSPKPAKKGDKKSDKKGDKSRKSDPTKSAETNVAQESSKEPEHIKVQHILIGFSGSVPGKSITRTLEEAKTLAYSLLDSAKAGTSFDDLVVRHTDDSPPGIYGMSNTGVAPTPGAEYARGSMVPAFGNVGFKLAVGEIGVADYDPRTSPYGYHVIKRIQ